MFSNHNIRIWCIRRKLFNYLYLSRKPSVVSFSFSQIEAHKIVDVEELDVVNTLILLLIYNFHSLAFNILTKWRALIFKHNIFISCFHLYKLCE